MPRVANPRLKPPCRLTSSGESEFSEPAPFAADLPGDPVQDSLVAEPIEEGPIEGGPTEGAAVRRGRSVAVER